MRLSGRFARGLRLANTSRLVLIANKGLPIVLIALVVMCTCVHGNPDPGQARNPRGRVHGAIEEP